MLPTFSFKMKALPPFRLDFTVWTLRRRDCNMIDRWDGETYRRVLVIEGKPMEIAITQPDKSNETLHISVEGAAPTDELKGSLIAVIETMLGTKRDCADFYDTAARSDNLYSLANRFKGAKTPRFPTVFEAVANGIACQQLSIEFGITLLNRLSSAVGKSLTLKSGVVHAFPSPEEVISLTMEELGSMSFSKQKARALLELAKTIIDGETEIENFAEFDDDEISEMLQKLRGVGRWTAEYVMLRGMGRLNVFPGDDVGAQKSLQNWLNLPTRPAYDEVVKANRPWQQYAGFVYFHLLLNGLATKGHITDTHDTTENLVLRES
ncbi:MAG: DNA-3-methyladenine glycosylase 2 family protein [Synergistaceae bacterium]|nr:DNA-3-methyladenine glycosylase 2 family protein [Synergistaceae bacterium]